MGRYWVTDLAPGSFSKAKTIPVITLTGQGAPFSMRSRRFKRSCVRSGGNLRRSLRAKPSGPVAAFFFLRARALYHLSPFGVKTRVFGRYNLTRSHAILGLCLIPKKTDSQFPDVTHAAGARGSSTLGLAGFGGSGNKRGRFCGCFLCFCLFSHCYCPRDPITS